MAAQVTPGWGYRHSVVLRGYQYTQIGADWSDDETDEFCVGSSVNSQSLDKTSLCFFYPTL